MFKLLKEDPNWLFAWLGLLAPLRAGIIFLVFGLLGLGIIHLLVTPAVGPFQRAEVSPLTADVISFLVFLGMLFLAVLVDNWLQKKGEN